MKASDNITITKKKILTNWRETHGPGLMWIDSPFEPFECDFCDNIKPLAHINCLFNNTIGICQDCLKEFLEAFNEKKDKHL